MAGSLNHIINNKTGGFTMSTIGNMGDAYEALEECYDIIAVLIQEDIHTLQLACREAGCVIPNAVPMLKLRHDSDDEEYDE